MNQRMVQPLTQQNSLPNQQYNSQNINSANDWQRANYGLQYYQDKKVDISFAEGLSLLVKNNKCISWFYLFRTFMLIGYFIGHCIAHNSYNAQDESSKTFIMINVFFIVGIVFNILCLVHCIVNYYKFLSNVPAIYDLAQKIQHIGNVSNYMNDQVPNNAYGNAVGSGFANDFVYHEHIPKLKVCTQKFQFSTNIATNQVDEQFKKRAIRSCQTMIIIQIDRNDYYRLSSQLLNLLSVSLFVYTIIVLSQEDVPSKQASFMITYMVSQTLTRVMIYLILLVVALSPLICLGVCVYSCFFAKGQQKIVLPDKQSASLDIIRECEGQCPICYQSINQGEQVVVLRCSPKHVFHQLCIKGWTKIGKTCPICRQNIGIQ